MGTRCYLLGYCGHERGDRCPRFIGEQSGDDYHSVLCKSTTQILMSADLLYDKASCECCPRPKRCCIDCHYQQMTRDHEPILTRLRKILWYRFKVFWTGYGRTKNSERASLRLGIWISRKGSSVSHLGKSTLRREISSLLSWKMRWVEW